MLEKKQAKEIGAGGYKKKKKQHPPARTQVLNEGRSQAKGSLKRNRVGEKKENKK